jgi:hypothetical protein
MGATVTHVATHLSPISCHLCPELRHLPLRHSRPDDNHRAFVWKDEVTVMLTMFVRRRPDQLQVATDLGNAIVAKL